ncbi:MAG: addiction module protein [Sulfuricellaceae bacterium]
MNIIEIPQIATMSTPEKIVFIEDLWDSIATDGRAIPVPENHIRELEKRLARHGSNPDSLLSLQELQQKIALRT